MNLIIFFRSSISKILFKENDYGALLMDQLHYLLTQKEKQNGKQITFSTKKIQFSSFFEMLFTKKMQL